MLADDFTDAGLVAVGEGGGGEEHVGGVEVMAGGVFAGFGLLSGLMDAEGGGGGTGGDQGQEQDDGGAEPGDRRVAAAPFTPAFEEAGRAGVNGFVIEETGKFIGNFARRAVTAGGFLSGGT